MPRLGVNIDHVATLRQARGGKEPDPVTAAPIVEMAGADGLVVHLREDRRHVQDRDLKLIRAIVQTKLNLEMAATDEMTHIAMEIKPQLVTLVPERREELTTEGGLDVESQRQRLKDVIALLHQAGIAVSVFINPEMDQIKAARRIDADCIELHTGRYADAIGLYEQDRQFDALVQGARAAYKLGMAVSAGHGLNYRNIGRLRSINEIIEYNVGHSIIARALYVGLDKAVHEMKERLG